jgi:hypothetical protein
MLERRIFPRTSVNNGVIFDKNATDSVTRRVANKVFDMILIIGPVFDPAEGISTCG